jgi:hypothetical protein
MKRTAMVGLFLSTLLLLQGHRLADAQQNTTPANKTDYADQKPSLKWETIDEFKVLKVWQLEGKDVWPQISILRVSNATYLKYLQNPKGLVEFVNQHKIFSKRVIDTGPWVSLSSAGEKDDPPNWDLTLSHGKLSRMIVSALPQLPDESGSK